MRSAADSSAMHHVEQTFQAMQGNPCAVRFRLAIDGFSPVGFSRKSYSIWPVMFINYNNTSLPVIEELKALWDGVPAYDMRPSCPEEERRFVLNAIWLWTIHDSPGVPKPPVTQFTDWYVTEYGIREGVQEHARSGLNHIPILAELPYYDSLLIQNLGDPMHQEGNITKNLLRHLFGHEDEMHHRKACKSLMCI
ncbi:hypothetical protein R1sor_013475 [Riccia sorocarpa]|uniref:Uncharacterized protein n=1 Tax=Riccia sorocarpa TaxID=122646 RepID=A0ABD3H8M8_9MARC